MNELTIDNQKYPVLNFEGRPAAMLDRHVAEIYNVKTEAVNRAVSNNPDKFPKEFSYRLTSEELTKVQETFLHLGNLKYSPHLPQAFSWEGCNMLATILKSDVAAQRAIQIVRGFTLLERNQDKLKQSTPVLAPLLPSLEDKATNVLSNWIKAAAILKVPEHLAQVEAVKAVHSKTAIDFAPLLLQAPAQDNISERNIYLEVTEIGKRIGLSARKVNTLLESQRLQKRDGKIWVRTEEGKRHSQIHQWSSGSKSGYNFKWEYGFIQKLWNET